MKRIISIIAAASMILAAGCQKQTIESGADIAEVSFSVELPTDLDTKAIADGSSATELYYAIFNSDGEYIQSLAYTAPVPVVGKTATISGLKLVRSYEYKVVFWAQAPGAPYKFNHAKGTATVDYSGDSNSDIRDAFCQLHTFMVPDADTWKETVYLRRPFAQINFGASDFSAVEELDLSVISKVEIDGLPNTYDILNGTLSGSVSTSFTPNAVPEQWMPAENLEVNGTDYAYVSMSYILAPVNEYDAYGNVIKDTKELANIKAIFTYKNNGESVEVNVPNVPYQRNFRTNIIGDIFTTDVKLEIIIDEEFYKPDNLVELK